MCERVRVRVHVRVHVRVRLRVSGYERYYSLFIYKTKKNNSFNHARISLQERICSTLAMTLISTKT